MTENIAASSNKDSSSCSEAKSGTIAMKNERMHATATEEALTGELRKVAGPRSSGRSGVFHVLEYFTRTARHTEHGMWFNTDTILNAECVCLLR